MINKKELLEAMACQVFYQNKLGIKADGEFIPFSPELISEMKNTFPASYLTAEAAAEAALDALLDKLPKVASKDVRSWMDIQNENEANADLYHQLLSLRRE